MKVKCDDKEILLTKAFIEAVKEMMTEEILMFRVREPEYRESWVVGACHIEDIMSANCMRFTFGGYDEKEYLIKDAHITVEIPL